MRFIEKFWRIQKDLYGIAFIVLCIAMISAAVSQKDPQFLIGALFFAVLAFLFLRRTKKEKERRKQKLELKAAKKNPNKSSAKASADSKYTDSSYSTIKSTHKTQKTNKISVLLESMESRPEKETTINNFENQFFNALEEKLHFEGLSVGYFRAVRLWDGGIRLTCPAGIIGTVHLRKRFGSIHYFTSLYDNYYIENAPIEAIIAVIPYWIEYAKSCIRMREAALSV